MTFGAIKAVAVAGMAADDSVPFLWGTIPAMLQAAELMAGVALHLQIRLSWAKDRAGTGYWSRNQHELLLFGTRGNPPRPRRATEIARPRARSGRWRLRLRGATR
jgi:N6-adenosine-specific RNA methylase IME4